MKFIYRWSSVKSAFLYYIIKVKLVDVGKIFMKTIFWNEREVVLWMRSSLFAI